MQHQIQVMLDLQDSMNARVQEDWINQGFEWYRAIWIECAELMDHYGWKWWKKQSPDAEQVKLELIDIWHFGLSLLIIEGKTAESIAETLSKSVSKTDEDFKCLVEAFSAHTLITQQFSIEKFAPLLGSMEMSFDDLYAGYVGKNVLNFFRQDHGYKEGTYQKLWAGQEDNEHLVEALKELDTSAATFKEDLYQALAHRYQTLCG